MAILCDPSIFQEHPTVDKPRAGSQRPPPASSNRRPSWRDRPWGVVLLLSTTMDMQQRNRSLSTILDGRHELLVGLGERTAAAFAPLVHTARAAGVVRPGVTVRDLLLAMQMVTVAFTEGDPRTSAKTFRRAKAMLFTTGIDGISS